MSLKCGEIMAGLNGGETLGGLSFSKTILYGYNYYTKPSQYCQRSVTIGYRPSLSVNAMIRLTTFINHCKSISMQLTYHGENRWQPWPKDRRKNWVVQAMAVLPTAATLISPSIINCFGIMKVMATTSIVPNSREGPRFHGLPIINLWYWLSSHDLILARETASFIHQLNVPQGDLVLPQREPQREVIIAS